MPEILAGDPFEKVVQQTTDIMQLSVTAKRISEEGPGRNIVVESLLAAIWTLAGKMAKSLEELRQYHLHHRKTGPESTEPPPKQRSSAKGMTKTLTIPATRKRKRRTQSKNKDSAKRGRGMTLENPKAFGIRLRTRREDLGWKIAELAKRAAVCARTVQIIESGRTARIQRKTLEKVAKALRVKPTDLLDGPRPARRDNDSHRAQAARTEAAIAAHKTGYDLQHFYETGERVPIGGGSRDDRSEDTE
jgi:transcriptional regulator with XRE-family HTH domain